MYVRSDGRQRLSKDISIPQNYSGNAFVSKDTPKSEPEESATGVEAPEAETVEVSAHISDERKGFLSGITGNDDLLLLGLLLLLSQEGFGDDILPIILIMLFFKK